MKCNSLRSPLCCYKNEAQNYKKKKKKTRIQHAILVLHGHLGNGTLHGFITTGAVKPHRNTLTTESLQTFTVYFKKIYILTILFNIKPQIIYIFFFP